MATTRRMLVNIFIAALVASSCFTDVDGAVSGTLAAMTTLQSAPGNAGNVITTLDLGTTVSVQCRRQSDYVYDDNWWLQVSVSGTVGWVADYYVVCGGVVGPCVVPSC